MERAVVLVTILTLAVPALLRGQEPGGRFLERSVRIGEASYAYKVYLPPGFDPRPTLAGHPVPARSGGSRHRRRAADRGGARPRPARPPRAVPGGGGVPAGAARPGLARRSRPRGHDRARPDHRRVPRRSRPDLPRRPVDGRLRILGAGLREPRPLRGHRVGRRRHRSARRPARASGAATADPRRPTIRTRRPPPASRASRPGCSMARTTRRCP